MMGSCVLHPLMINHVPMTTLADMDSKPSVCYVLLVRAGDFTWATNSYAFKCVSELFLAQV